MNPPRLGHRPALDGLRGVAVALVVSSHAWDWPRSGGELGVEIFFVLSGFLITTLLLEENDRKGSVSFSRFYMRRALRLLPVLYAALAIIGVVVLVHPTPDRSWYIGSIASAAFYVGNLYGLFAAHHDLAEAVGHLWSLAVEEQFYLVWPFVLVGLLRVTRRSDRGLAAVMLAGIAISILLRAGISTQTTAWWTLPTTYSDALLAGALIAFVRRFRTLPRVRLLAAGLLAVACVMPAVDRSVGRGLLLSWLVVVGVALVVAALSEPVLLRQGPLVFLGSISYGLYLFHVPLLVGARAVIPDMNADLRGLLVVGASVLLATASRWWFEEWFLRRKPVGAKDGDGLLADLLIPGDTRAEERPAVT